MLATLTSKGQTKEIRDRLNLTAGSILDFQLQADNTITARRTPGASAGCSSLRMQHR